MSLLDEPGVLTGLEIAERLRRIAAERSALAAEELALVAMFDACGEYVAEGFTSTPAWLVHNASQSRAEANATLRDAKVLVDRPVLADAVEEIGARRARIIAAGAAKAARKTTSESVDETVAVLIEAARSVRVDDVSTLVTQWLRALDRDGSEPPDEIGTLILSRFGEVTNVTGAFRGATGAYVGKAVDRQADRIWRAERSCPDGITSTPAQRRAEALVELIRRGELHITGDDDQGTLDLDTDEPSDDPAHAAAPSNTESDGRRVTNPPLLFVTMTLDELEGRAEGTAELDGYGRLLPGEATRLLCDSRVVRYVTDGDSRLLDLGTATSTISTAQRRAVRIRDKHCVVPGCGLPPEWCDVHHVHWVEHGGPTDLDWLALLCRRHHRYVHAKRIQIEPDGRGGFTVRKADGTQIPKTPLTP